MKLLAAYFIGLLFGVGISLSGMANPAKVLNFFDIAGAWDPSLAFVMGGAVMTTFLGYRWVLKRAHPFFDTSFSLPTRTDIDSRLVSGALIFGIGWGLAGFCPGGAMPVLGTGNTSVALFVVAMLSGIILTRRIDKVISSKIISPLSTVKAKH